MSCPYAEYNIREDFMGMQTVETCHDGYTYDNGTCYRDFNREKYVDVGTSIREKCNNGYDDKDGECVNNSIQYDRGLGRSMFSCRNDEDQHGLMCYPKCRPGFKSSGQFCTPDKYTPKTIVKNSYVPISRINAIAQKIDNMFNDAKSDIEKIKTIKNNLELEKNKAPDNNKVLHILLDKNISKANDIIKIIANQKCFVGYSTKPNVSTNDWDCGKICPGGRLTDGGCRCACIKDLNCNTEQTIGNLVNYYQNKAHTDWKITNVLKSNNANNNQCDMLFNARSNDNRTEKQARRFTLNENNGNWIVDSLGPGGSGTTVM